MTSVMPTLTAQPAPPRPVAAGPDRPRAIAAVRELLAALGRDVTDEHIAQTPRRVADAFLELLTPVDFEFTTFPNDRDGHELVLVRDIAFHSVCEHHLLPFHGVAHIGYLPGSRIVGLSKLVRVLEYFARDLQVQERLTQQVADFLAGRLDARGVGVVLDAEHSCMAFRGVRAPATHTVTTAFHGALAADDRARDRFLQAARA